ncbi:MAG: hypothetical protein CEE38_08255 [Planctomycetes bacterium B3_Pla]|nr:MAG: hypothetical protein CEE38_08255 [Planctomycetes bacterium B3_Pla]
MDGKEQLVEAILETANGGQDPDGKKILTCSEAFELAKKFETEVAEIGRICNQHDIKICKCQLGFF